MGKKKLIMDWIDLVPYPSSVGVVFGQQELFKSFLIENHTDDYRSIPNDFSSAAYTFKFTPPNSCPIYYAWFSNKPTDNSEIAVVAHEALHITFYCLENVGLELSNETQEAYTYMMQYLTQTILNIGDRIHVEAKDTGY